jgi:Leucine-rich repeat (LRR) protein
LFAGCPKPQKPEPVTPSDPPATVKPAAPQQTPEEKAVSDLVTQLGGTLRTNQARKIIGVVIENTGKLTVADMQLIAKLSDLESIRLVGPTVTDDYVEALSGLTKLKSVDIENSNITNKSLEILKELPEIETLALRRNLGFTDDAIKLFAEFPNLKTLRILYNGFSAASLLGLRELKAIRVLDLRALPVGDDTLISISKLENLEEIRIRSTSVTNSGMTFLKRCKNLKILELQDTSIETGCAETLAEMESLRYLRIFRAPQFGASEIQQLGAMTNLETLELRSLYCSNEALLALKPLTQLKTVELSELTDTDEATVIDVLKAFPKLESIRLFAMPVGDDVAAFLATVPAMRSVALPATTLSDKGLDSLTALQNLQTLDIHANKENITLQGAQVLGKFKNLRRLFLPETLKDDALNTAILKSSPRCEIEVKTYTQEN